MAQNAPKLLSEVKPKIINCDLGNSFFVAKGRIRFFCISDEKVRFGTFVATVKKKFFSSQGPDNTYIPGAALPKQTFSRHWRWKILYSTWQQKKIAPNHSLPPSASSRKVMYLRFGPFLTFLDRSRVGIYCRINKDRRLPILLNNFNKNGHKASG